jgi:hypothetical protein
MYEETLAISLDIDSKSGVALAQGNLAEIWEIEGNLERKAFTGNLWRFEKSLVSNWK